MVDNSNKKSSVYNTLSKINVNEYVEKKGMFNYLSWAYAVQELLKKYPNATWGTETYERTYKKDGVSVTEKRPYMETPSGFYVSTWVEVDGIKRTFTHPVLDNRNRALMEVNSFQINTSQQRCLTKNIALFGLGLYIYAGEDLPQGMEEPEPEVSIHPAEGDAKEAKGYKLISEVFTTFIPECEDVATLRSFWGKNKNALEILKKGNKELYEKVLGNFTEHSETLKKGEAA